MLKCVKLRTFGDTVNVLLPLHPLKTQSLFKEQGIKFDVIAVCRAKSKYLSLLSVVLVCADKILRQTYGNSLQASYFKLTRSSIF